MSYCRICRAELPIQAFDDHETICVSCLRAATAAPRAALHVDELTALLRTSNPATRERTRESLPPARAATPRPRLRATWSSEGFRWEIERSRR